MKILPRIMRLAVGTIVLALVAAQAWAQSYYSLQQTNWPPLPANQWSLPILDLGDNAFLLLDQDVDYLGMQEEADFWTALARALEPASLSGYGIYSPTGGSGDCASELAIVVFPTNDANTITLTITKATDGVVYDLFRTFELLGDNATNSVWRWIGNGTNGQKLTFPNVRCRQAFYVLGCAADSDGDGLTDAFERLVSKTSPLTNHTYSAELTDLDWWLRSNILVNDPEQDCGNEQNSQFESTVAVLNGNVIVAYVDSNHGVYELGHNSHLGNYTNRLVAYCVSRDGGVSFEDRGVPPLSRDGIRTTMMATPGILCWPWTRPRGLFITNVVE